MTGIANIAKRGESLPEAAHDMPVYTPLVDIFENENEILLHADLPGINRKDISVNIDNGTLEIRGVQTASANGAVGWEEFGHAEFRRRFSVPQTIDVSKVEAELKDGVLKLHLPKSEAAKPKVIEIKAV